MNFKMNRSHYFAAMASCKDLIIDLDKLQQDQAVEMSAGSIFMYNVKRISIQLLRPFYKLMKGK